MRLSPATLTLSICALCVLASARLVASQDPRQDASAPIQADPGYRIGSQDVLNIAIWGHAELSGKFRVAADGSLSFPLIGLVEAGDRTVSEIRTELTRRLEDGYLKNARVSVEIEQYVSQRVFVMGEVRIPGAIPLTGAMTLLEALARAGSLTEQAGGELVILRGEPDRDGNGPLAPGQSGASELGRLSVEQLRRGAVVANISLRNGDTVFVPRAETIYVLGLVNNPGTYTLEPGLTVLRALSLAGGTTPLGSTGRIRIVRIVAGQKREIKAKLDESLKPGDTVVVGARLF